MTDDTRAMLERNLGTLYEPTAWATSIFGIIRNVIFGCISTLSNIFK